MQKIVNIEHCSDHLMVLAAAQLALPLRITLETKAIFPCSLLNHIHISCEFHADAHPRAGSMSVGSMY